LWKLAVEMGQRFKLDDKEYEVDDLSGNGRVQLEGLKFTTERIQELTNMQALLKRAKNSYVDSLKQEMLSQKAGFLFEDN
jgi:hypothetical protein